MTETSVKKTVHCQIHNIEFPVSTCLARQKILAAAPTTGLKGEAYNQFKMSCGVCEIGHKLYSESLKNAEIKPIQNELVQVPSPNKESSLNPPKIESSEKQPVESKNKICALQSCGKEIKQREDESIHAYVARKYCCEECAKSADRARDSARKRRERAHRSKAMVFDCDMAKKIAEKLVNENSDVFEVVTDNGAQNLLIKKIITNICIEAQRASHKSLWNV